MLDQAVLVEERAIESDAPAHHFHESVAVLIERWNNRVLEFVVDAASFWRLACCPNQRGDAPFPSSKANLS
jgi:hypothetical protein